MTPTQLSRTSKKNFITSIFTQSQDRGVEKRQGGEGNYTQAKTPHWDSVHKGNGGRGIPFKHTVWVNMFPSYQGRVGGERRVRAGENPLKWGKVGVKCTGKGITERTRAKAPIY